ncbi:interferon-related developmental regulator 2 [Anopheles ziemanni]|uniref:interferon-related developmental regulator 2 n=1 Tax=Anopheles coustani TaxID=139045 RepID=UPI00265A3FCC|nr:interferon-related developmental regulator 2 [Anopheles coustani]XP_058128196.1 interferon-related developmental regulator 2 [Anopheles coustani]XP_058175918.1 interferon-related developmental regulator 2 [Anopheles ziemanni]
MPRNRKKQSAADTWQQNNDQSDDDTWNDNASTYSCHSETQNGDGGHSGSQDGGDDGSSGGNGFEKYEEKLLQAIENASDKSLQTRINAFQTINEVLVHHYIPEFIDDRKVTLMDAVEKSLRRGKGVEQAWAARIIPLLVIQIEALEDIGTLVRVLKPVLLATAQDGASAYDARAKCCAALGLLCFVGVDDLGEVLPLMKTLQSIFTGSYLKGDNSPSNANAEAAALHSAALSAWALLLTLLPPSEVVTLATTGTGIIPSVHNLVGMLQSPHLDVRMVAGEIIALLFELGRHHDDEFLDDQLTDVIEATQKLATDAHKYRAKRDRKVQRATFRDVLHYLEEDVSPEISIKFGRETLLLNSWAIHHQYTCLRNALGFGMNVHLGENLFVREVLQLGAKIDEPERLRKTVKAEQRFLNAAAFKARTISRSKNRDKRSFAIN